MSPDLQEKLYKKYPKIFADVNKPPNESAMAYGITCDDGWYDLIDNLCWFIQSTIDRTTYIQIPQVVAQQVKQKLAGLRFNVTGGDEGILGAIEFAEQLSFTVCESCGSSKAKRFNDGGYLWTACDICKNRKEIE
jgi:hypothetical protein